MKNLNNILALMAAMTLLFSSCIQEETAQPRKTDLVDAVFASGEVIAEEEYKVTAKAEGYLLQSFVVEGATVDPQMPLYQLSGEVQSAQLQNAQVVYADAVQNTKASAPAMAQLELQLQQSKSQLALDQKNEQRYAQLLKTKAVSQLEYDQMALQNEQSKRNVAINEKALADFKRAQLLNAENAKTQLQIQQQDYTDYFLRSSIHGTVLQVYQSDGDLVSRGETVALIGGGKQLARLFVSEEDINDIAINQQVVVRLNTDRDRVYDARISKIYPSFDQAEQSFVVEASFDNPPANLYHNTQLQANIVVADRKQAMVIPSEFLSNGDSVLLAGGAVKSVKIGIRNEQWVEVLDGLSTADKLIKPRS